MILGENVLLSKASCTLVKCTCIILHTHSPSTRTLLYFKSSYILWETEIKENECHLLKDILI